MALSTLQPFSLQTWEWYGLSYLLVKQEVNKHINLTILKNVTDHVTLFPTIWTRPHTWSKWQMCFLPVTLKTRHVHWRVSAKGTWWHYETVAGRLDWILLDFCAPFSVIATTFPQRRWNSPSYRQRQACWNFIARAQFGYVYTTN